MSEPQSHSGKRTGKRITYEKKDKKDKKNNIGWMEGKREAVFLPTIPSFVEAVDRGWQQADIRLKELQAMYHALFPWPMQDHDEPDTLPEYDPLAPVGHDKQLSDKEAAEKGAHILEMNERLHRWLVRQAAKLRSRVNEMTRRDPADTYAILMARICGVEKPPRQPHAAHMFQRANWDEGLMLATMVEKAWTLIKTSTANEKPPDFGVEIVTSALEGVDREVRDRYSFLMPKMVERVDAMWIAKRGGTKKTPVNMGTDFVRELFKLLPEEERNQWGAEAQERGDKEKAAYKAILAEPPSKSAEDRASAVAHTHAFVGEINRGIEERTFCRVFTMVGGPMNMYGGEYGTINVTTSKNKADVPLTFPEWLGKTKMDALIVDYKAWLATCYDDEDRKSTVIDSDTGTGGHAGNGAKACDSVLEREVAKRDRFIDESLLEKMKSFDDWEGEQSNGEMPGAEKVNKRRRNKGDNGDGSDEESTPSKKARLPTHVAPDPADLTPKPPVHPPGLSEYERTMENNKWRNKLMLAGLSHMQETGNLTAGLTADDYFAHAVEGIRNGTIRDPSQPPTPKAARPKPKRVKKAVASSTTRADPTPTCAEGTKDVGMEEPDVEMDTGTQAKISGNTERSHEDAGMEPELERDTGTQAEILGDPERADELEAAREQVPASPITAMADGGRAVDGDVQLEVEMARIRDLLSVAPSWLADAVTEFMEAAGGNDILTMLRLLLEIENENGWTAGDAKGLQGVRLRPALVSTWINQGRTRNGVRLVLSDKDADTFVSSWSEWWAYLQSPWRERDDFGEWKREGYGDAWDRLNVPGKNGMLSVVAVLSWWRSYDEQHTRKSDEWEAARVDVQWVMKGLLDFLRRKSPAD